MADVGGVGWRDQQEPTTAETPRRRQLVGGSAGFLPVTVLSLMDANMLPQSSPAYVALAAVFTSSFRLISSVG